MTYCPLCHSATPMHASTQHALLASRPDKVLLTCPDCLLTLYADDLADFDAALYAAPVLTCAARTPIASLTVGIALS